MTWTISAQELAEGVDERRRRLDERRDADTLERYARALRWAGDAEGSTRVFREAAQAQVELLHHDRSAVLCSRAVGYFTLAGEPEPAREWVARALVELLDDVDPGLDELRRRNAATAVELLYLGDEPDRALAVAREHGIRPAAVELIEAQDREAADAVIARLAERLVADRVPPYVTGSGDPLTTWDWLELAFVTRARIAGEATPTHGQMLERAGLLGPGASRRTVRLEPGGIDRFAVTAADGGAIEASVNRETDDWIEITLDPREPHYLALAFGWDDDWGYQGELYLDRESSAQGDLPYEGRDFREAIAATADWFEGEDVFGRDGTWAARTLTAITRDLPVRAE